MQADTGESDRELAIVVADLGRDNGVCLGRAARAEVGESDVGDR